MASSSETNALRFAKMNGSNYRTWVFNMRLYLESLDLFDHVTGTAAAPGEDASDETRRNFNLGTKKAWTHICLAIEPEQQLHVRETKTAKEAWDALKKQFARESLLQKVRLRQQYHSCRFHSGDNMLEHISKLRSLHDQLKEMGVEIDDKELAMTLLASLPEDYKPLITALDAVGEGTLSYEKVKNMLLNQVDRSKDSRSSEDAFSMRKGKFYKNKQSKFESGNTSPNKEKIFRGKCHNCQERGHFARDCPKRNAKEDSNSPKYGGNKSKGAARCAEDQRPDKCDDEALPVYTPNAVGKSDWIIDSGATQHMSFERNRLSEYVEFKQPCVVNLGDSRTILAYGKGIYHITADVDGHAQPISLREVLYLPDLDKNLLSVRAMVKLGATIMFEDGVCKVSRNAKLLAIGIMVGKLYVLKVIPEEHVNIAMDESSLKLWHYRFGHLGMENIMKLVNDKLVEGMDNATDLTSVICEACIMGKQHRCPYPKGSAERATEPFQLIHSDVCGPMSTTSLGGSRYYVTFIDDYTRYTTVYFLKTKDEVLEKFKEFHNFTINHTGKQIQTLRTDNGGEYCSKAFDTYLKENGITHQLTVPFNPAQNGVAERMNRTVVESARSMLSHSNMPNEFWAEAVNTSVYLRNRSPTTALDGITPYECLFNQKPDVANLRVFGCVSYVHVPDNQRTKLDAKSRKVIFVGYRDNTKGYKLYDPVCRKFVRSRDVIFVERKFHDFGEGNSVEVDIQNIPVEDDRVDHDEPEQPVREPENRNQPVGATYEENFIRETQNLDAKRQRRPPTRFDEETYVAADNLTADIDEPVNIQEAWTGEHSIDWKRATNSEYESLINNQTWELVPPPDGKNIVGSRWVFKVKHTADGTVERFKARLVAQGYSQSHGVDYQEIFSPVVRYSSIRSLLAVANICNWEVHQMDVKTAFLQGELNEEIYMKQPEGYVDPDKPDYVCKLNKSIYGLKQAARCWNFAIDTYLKSNGYRKSSADPCIYIKSVRRRDGKIDFVILALYVDDILWFSNNAEMLKKEKEALAKRFKVDDMGEVSYVLGMSVKRNREARRLTINQPKYLEGILKRFGMETCKPVTTPLEPGRKFESLPENETPVDVQGYQMAIGCLTYASTATRPDLAAAVGILSKYMSRPGKDHWQGVKRVLRYIKGTLNYGLMFTASGDNPILHGFSDADWGGDVETRRSTSGYVFQIQSNTISWCSKRQTSVSRSTTEAEYIALSTACQELVWLRRLLSDVGLKQDVPSIIYEDNQGAIELSRNPKFHNRTKHIDVSFHFIREQVNNNKACVKYCPTEDMLADIMTKVLPKVSFTRFRDIMGVGDIV